MNHEPLTVIAKPYSETVGGSGNGMADSYKI